MRPVRMQTAVSGLRWILGAVILVQSLIFVFDKRAGQALHHAGIPDIVHYALGLSETMSAALFLFTSTLIVGGRFLFAVLCAAALFHIAHGDFNVGGLLVDSAAVLVVLAHHGHHESPGAP